MGAPAASSSTTLLIDQVGLEFWGLLGIEVCKVPGIKKHPLVSSREKSQGNVKKVLLEFILVDLKWDRKAVSYRGTPETQTQLDGGLLPMSPPSTQTPHLQVLCKGQEQCPEEFRMLWGTL